MLRDAERICTMPSSSLPKPSPQREITPPCGCDADGGACVETWQRHIANYGEDTWAALDHRTRATGRAVSKAAHATGRAVGHAAQATAEATARVAVVGALGAAVVYAPVIACTIEGAVVIIPVFVVAKLAYKLREHQTGRRPRMIHLFKHMLHAGYVVGEGIYKFAQW
mmetsp:Transcript_47142/g.111040  ORF Transcript_47142/g.111040 Transcript_47142/m.111040 type:complete len:168 (+) Transcript_47142:2122-2625(+)